MDRLLAKMDRVVEKVNHASYGYSGFFDAVKVKEDNLDRMIDFRQQTYRRSKRIDHRNRRFQSRFSQRQQLQTLKTRVQNVTDKLESLENTFDQRNEVIIGVS